MADPNDRSISLKEVSHTIDRLITADVSLRGVIQKLYHAAKRDSNAPLTYTASKGLLESVQEGDIVFIATGWPDRPDVSPQILEADGPPGAVVLARALHRAFSAIPILLVEKSGVEQIQQILQAGGLKPMDPDLCITSTHVDAPIHSGSVIPFSTDLAKSKEEAVELVERFQPSALITIEKGGMNSEGYIHSCRGKDITENMAKIDSLVEEAKKQGILTIGIGDGGNEIGMANIRDDLEKWLSPTVIPATTTDYLVTATVSNWGGYGIAACLAILRKEPEIFHCPRMERRILESCAEVGLIDGVTGYVGQGVDGLSTEAHVSLVLILRELVEKAIMQGFSSQ